MAESIENRVISKIKKARKGALFFTEDFLSFGNAKAIAKALERLTEGGELIRAARGVYARPRKNPILGEIRPSAEAIVDAIAKRDRARIVPTGVLALNALGLSTQVPMNIVYLTDGTPRKILLGKRKVLFKKSAPKNLAAIGKISSLCIQALKVIGKDQVTEEEKRKILMHLKKEEKSKLEYDTRLAPEWIRKIMREALEN